MKVGDIVEHYKGGKYLILAIGKFQCSTNKELEGQEMVMYFSIKYQSLNFRLLKEFEDEIKFDGKYLKRFEVTDDRVLIACTMPDRRNLLNMIDTFELPEMLGRLWVGLDLVRQDENYEKSLGARLDTPPSSLTPTKYNIEERDRLFEELIKAKAENDVEKAQELADKLNKLMDN